MQNILIKLNHDLFNQNLNHNIDIKQYQAYIIGFILNCSHVSNNNKILKIKISKEHENFLYLLEIFLDNNILQYEYNIDLIKIKISSSILCQEYLKIFKINSGKNNFNIICPAYFNINSLNYWAFIRGYYDYNGIIENKEIPHCIILFNSKNVLKYFDNIIIPHIKLNNIIQFTSTNCIDFLGKIYKNKLKFTYNKDKYQQFLNLLNWKNIINKSGVLDKCVIYKTDNNAILPCKNLESDVGYDITIIKKIKNLTPSTILYDTGIKINVDYGYYIEIVPRSSLSKSGYILANSIGIIEKSYSGNLLVALTKIDKEMPDLELPFKCCQLIFKVQISLKIEEIYNKKNINLTTRNIGGFGSSN